MSDLFNLYKRVSLNYRYSKGERFMLAMRIEDVSPCGECLNSRFLDVTIVLEYIYVLESCVHG